MGTFVKVATVSDIPEASGLCVTAGGKKIALFNVGGTIHAIDDTCTHRGGPLSEGELSGTEVTCPWHCGLFNVTTGAVLGPPATQDVASYKVRVEGNDVEVEVEAA